MNDLNESAKITNINYLRNEKIDKLMGNQEQIQTIYKELVRLSDDEKKAVLPRFFKTGKGEYGEGDKFIGVIVPNVRTVARAHKDCSLDIVAELLCSEWHECRLCALLILREKFKKSPDSIVDFYLSHTKGINNWDLVDLSAPYILGEYLLIKQENPKHESIKRITKDQEGRKILYDLAESEVMWERRIAVVSTLMLIRHNQFDDTIRLAEKLLNEKHDLMQKAIGWMLREVGKRDETTLKAFLEKHCTKMPRTMLRYAIEKFPPHIRQEYMQRK